MNKLLLLSVAILIFSGCPSNTSSTSYSIGNVVVSWNALTPPGAFVLVGLGAPNMPGNPQTIPWPSPQPGQNWLVSDPGYSDDGYIYQWNGTWVQQGRALDEIATIGGTDYVYTSTGWIISPVYYAITQTPGYYGQASAITGSTGTSQTLDLAAGTYSFTVSAYTYVDGTLLATALALPSSVTVSVGQTSYATAPLP